MENLDRITELLRYICRHVVRQMEIELQRFATALEAWVNELLVRRLPADWRERMHAYLDGWESNGFGVAKRHRPILENWIESWAKARGLLPENSVPAAQTGLDAASPTRDFVMAEAFRMGTSAATIQTLLEHPDAFKDWSSPRPRKVVRVEKVQGIGSWYDEAVATGQYDPNYLTRVALGTVRVLFPDSEPTTIITYADGTREIILGGGPSSGAMGNQAMALAGFGQAIVGKRLATELAEAVVDTAVQEATGSPVGPSALRSRSRRKPSTPPSAPRTNAELVQDIATRAEAKINKPGRVPGIHKHTYAKKLLDRHQSIYGDRGLRTEITILLREEVEYSTSDAVRLDVLEGAVDKPIAIYDYKFGYSRLSESRVVKIRRVTGYGTEVPIVEVKPRTE